MRSTSVSLCQIVRNEAHQLADCLAPVTALFDEVVVVHTGSSDGTQDVARRFTPHVHSFPWCDDFAAARNASLAQARGEWIFWLDADDRLTPENVGRLRMLLDRLGTQPQIYLMDTTCSLTYASEGSRVISHARLFRRHPDLRWQGRVHEQLRPAPATLGYETIWSDVQIDHVGYQDAALRQRKLQRDIRLLRMDYAVDPDDVSTLLHLGLSYARMGSNASARQHLERLLAAGLGDASHMRQVYGALAELSHSECKFHDVLQITKRGLLQFPDDEHLLYLQAEALYELDQYAAARVALARLLACPAQRQYRGGGLGEITTRLAPRLLSNVLRMEGNLAQAEATLRELIQKSKSDTVSWYMLGWVYIDARRRPQLDEVVAALQSCPQGNIFSGLLQAAWHLQHRELDAAGLLIEQLVGLAPLMPLPRLLRLEWLRLSGAPVESQIQACRDALRIQPSNPTTAQTLANLENAMQRPTATSAASDFCTSVVLGAGVPNGIAPA